MWCVDQYGVTECVASSLQCPDRCMPLVLVDLVFIKTALSGSWHYWPAITFWTVCQAQRIQHVADDDLACTWVV